MDALICVLKMSIKLSIWNLFTYHSRFWGDNWMVRILKFPLKLLYAQRLFFYVPLLSLFKRPWKLSFDDLLWFLRYDTLLRLRRCGRALPLCLVSFDFFIHQATLLSVGPNNSTIKITTNLTDSLGTSLIAQKTDLHHHLFSSDSSTFFLYPLILKGVFSYDPSIIPLCIDISHVVVHN